VKILIAVNGKVGDTNISFDSFDVDRLREWICKELNLNVKDYRMIFHLVPSFKVDLIHDPQEKEPIAEEKTVQGKSKAKKSSIFERRKALKNKRSSAKALAEQKALELIEREKKRNEEMKQRALEAKATKAKFHQPKEKNEPSMLELVTAKLENVEAGDRLNPNPKLGFTLSNKLTEKIKKLHALLLDANLIERNAPDGKILTLKATAKECIEFIKELGEDR